jgi:hypothetical protein
MPAVAFAGVNSSHYGEVSLQPAALKFLVEWS